MGPENEVNLSKVESNSAIKHRKMSIKAQRHMPVTQDVAGLHIAGSISLERASVLLFC